MLKKIFGSLAIAGQILSLTGLVSALSPPAAPTGVVATALSSSQIRVSWTSVSGASGYKLQRGSGVIASLSSTEYTDTGLLGGSAYTYRVIASNAAGDSLPSAYASATTAAATASPAVGNDTPPAHNKLYVDERKYMATVDGKVYALDNLPPLETGQKLALYGWSVAAAQVVLNLDGQAYTSTIAASTGKWHMDVDITAVKLGLHQAELILRAKDQQNSKTFPFRLINPATAISPIPQPHQAAPAPPKNTLGASLASVISLVALTTAGAAVYWFKFRQPPGQHH